MAKKKSQDPGKYNARKGKFGRLGSEFTEMFLTKKAVESNQAANPWMNNGQRRDQIKETEALTQARKDLLAVDRNLQELARRRASVELGLYQNQLRAAQKYKAELGTIAALEQKAALQAKYGQKLGSAAYHVGGTAYNAGAATLATGAGMLTAGMSGTVEANRLAAEMKMISREIANAFKPAIDEAIAGLTGFRKILQSLNGNQQKYLMGGGLALAAGYGLHRAGMLGTAAGLAGRASPYVAMGLEGYDYYQAAGRAEERGGKAGDYAKEFGSTWAGKAPIAAGLNLDTVKSGYGGLRSAGYWLSKQFGGQKGFRQTSEWFDRNTFGLTEWMGGKPWEEGKAAPKRTLSLPGGEVNELGSTFFEAMNAAGKVGMDKQQQTETILGELFAWLQRRFKDESDPSFEQAAGSFVGDTTNRK